MRHCPSCGGIIGRDCFNPTECAWISEQQQRYHEQDGIKAAHAEGYREGQQMAQMEMDEYAKQQAEAFAEWLVTEFLARNPEIFGKTASELYQLFLNNKTIGK